MIIKRTEQVYIRGNDTISNMCHLSKNLYNQANYIVRQQFLHGERQTGYNNLVTLFQVPAKEDENNNYQKMPAQTSQWTIKYVKQAWNSYFKAMRAWKMHPEDFLEMPRIPKYKRVHGEYILIFTNQQCHIENGILIFPKIINLEVKIGLDENIRLKEVRIIPQSVGYNVEIVYDKEINDMILKTPERILGIDIGVTNLVTIGNNFSEKGIAIKAGLLKSINQYFNKELARLQSINDLQNKTKYKKNTEKINRLYMIRNRKIKDIMHKLSKAIIEYAYNLDVDTIVIGHNDGWKQSANNRKKKQPELCTAAIQYINIPDKI
jgi:transposase, IS605 OrfB family, central region